MGKFILICYVFSFGIFFSLLGTGYLIMKIAERVRKRRPRTRADMIRSMSDEELATALYLLRLDALQLEGFEGTIETKEEVLEWLKEEAEGEEEDGNIM